LFEDNRVSVRAVESTEMWTHDH